MNWTIFFIALGVNSFLCLAQFCAQTIDSQAGRIAPRHSIIPNTKQKFLYWQDFYTQLYGDTIGLMLVMNGFFHIMPDLNTYEWLAFSIITTLSSIAFFVPRLAMGHKTSWGEPVIGKISFGGYVHSFYFSWLAAMAAICIWSMFTDKLAGSVLDATIAGLIIWTLTCFADIFSGNFASLKIEVEKRDGNH